VGVDIENVKMHDDVLSIANRFFAPEDVRELHVLPKEYRYTRFFAYWTLRESYSKARGQGLTIPLDRFGFLLRDHHPIRIRLDPALDDEPTRWTFALLRASRHHMLALSLGGMHARWTLRHAFCVPLQGTISGIG
jgi:4'-phosphopantetheinyl transferase